MKKEMIFVLVIASAFALVMMGCQAQPEPIGGDKDEHGCIPSAGYSWCDAKEKCLRTWEENCTKECADSCPLISQPAPSFCTDGTIVDQGKDDCDCQLPPKCEKNDDNTQIANPASVFCIENGGGYEIITSSDGSQSGVCTLSDGVTKCDEWAYFRGECSLAEGLTKSYCTLAQKKADICTLEYAPVCGWFDESIKCFKYPCAQTYGNKCQACAAGNVAYWTEGECPE